MGENTKIQWADHTFNPWIGCTKVSAGCAHCYAEELMDKRWKKAEWGPNGIRVKTSSANWRKPYQWNAKAAIKGTRYKVFCASLCDVFEDGDDILNDWRDELFVTIENTQHLDWLLLTKRPENAFNLLSEKLFDNIWIGASAEDQATANERIPRLMEIPAKVHFLSCEPLLEPIIFKHVPGFDRVGLDLSSLWVIVGGESGDKSRPCNTDWIRAMIYQCSVPGVPIFVKQLGTVSAKAMDLKSSKGGDPSEWPKDLQIRQFPRVR